MRKNVYYLIGGQQSGRTTQYSNKPLENRDNFREKAVRNVKQFKIHNDSFTELFHNLHDFRTAIMKLLLVCRYYTSINFIYSVIKNGSRKQQYFYIVKSLKDYSMRLVISSIFVEIYSNVRKSEKTYCMISTRFNLHDEKIIWNQNYALCASLEVPPESFSK